MSPPRVRRGRPGRPRTRPHSVIVNEVLRPFHNRLVENMECMDQQMAHIAELQNQINALNVENEVRECRPHAESRVLVC